MSSPSNPFRLPTNVRPSAYRIEIDPDIDAASFRGSVQIDLEVASEAESISLNSVDLIFDSIEVWAADGTRGVTVVADEEYERVQLDLDRPLSPGPASVKIAFHGAMCDQLVGLYKSTYVDLDGESQSIATTQFEATDARRAFPCFDEPTFKATFQLTVRVAGGLTAYSNSPIVEESDNGDGSRTIRFGPTMKMSSYLVALVVGPFGETDAVDVNGVPLRVVYPRGKDHLARFALEAGKFALEFFSGYFAIPYPGDKLDLVAVPDFAFGAMENLGCVTFREAALLVDPASASLAELERVADVVAHEIAHMWFGDLVTMQWWEGIWLNEAFATFMETLCVESFRPQWKKWLSFVPSREMAMQIDGLHATRPIEYEVVSPTDMRGMFDALTYEKGCAVLRMLEQYVGAETFRDGIRLYLRRHSYANTVTTDLWNALEEVSGEPVREMMNTWILQGGHPLVSYEEGRVDQRPFAYLSERPADSAIGERWVVPIMSRSVNGGPITKQLLGDEPLEIVADGPMVVNAGGWGVYRTRYGQKELAAIAGSLDRLDEVERAVLVADGWAALQSGDVRWEDFLSLAHGLGDLDEPSSWLTVAQAFDVAHRVADAVQRERLAVTVRDVFAPQLKRLGLDPMPSESELAAQVRAIALGAVGTVGNDEVVRAECQTRFDADRLDGDTAEAVLRVVGWSCRPGDDETFLARYRAASSPQVERRYQWGLADFPDDAVALRAAGLCLSEFRTQDGPIVLGLLTRNWKSGPTAWRFMADHWDECVSRFPFNLVRRMCAGIPALIQDREFAAEVEEFHRSHPVEGEQRSVEQLIERMHIGLDLADALRRQL
jgi:puromycin-sensitive aminopeptidase